MASALLNLEERKEGGKENERRARGGRREEGGERRARGGRRGESKRRERARGGRREEGGEKRERGGRRARGGGGGEEKEGGGEGKRYGVNMAGWLNYWQLEVIRVMDCYW
jgi:hypothetical protein